VARIYAKRNNSIHYLFTHRGITYITAPLEGLGFPTNWTDVLRPNTWNRDRSQRHFNGTRNPCCCCGSSAPRAGFDGPAERPDYRRRNPLPTIPQGLHSGKRRTATFAASHRILDHHGDDLRACLRYRVPCCTIFQPLTGIFSEVASLAIHTLSPLPCLPCHPCAAGCYSSG